MLNVLNEEILYTYELAPGIHRMGLKSPRISSRAVPGQFVSIRCCDGVESLLRRPISICMVLPENNSFDIVFMAKGRGTEYLSKKMPGERVDTIGPLGNGFHIPENIEHIAVVGGGIGIFPLLFLLQSMGSSVVKHAFLGFKNKSCAVLLDEFTKASSEMFLSSDDGSIGHRGFVTDLYLSGMNENRYDMVYACGPSAMMEKVVIASSRKNIPCQVSLEQRMGCGIGACLACACKTRSDNGGWEYSRVCSDGPVFWGDKVIFE